MGARTTAGRLGAGAALLVLLAPAAAACGPWGQHGSTSAAESSCAAQLDFAHRVYSAAPGPDSLHMWVVPASHRRPIGPARYPPCNDTNGSSVAMPAAGDAEAIDGLDPAVAVATNDGGIWVHPARRIPASLAAEPWLQVITP